MPELPEVETLRRSLEPHLIGRRIESVVTSGMPLREPPPVFELERHAAGRRLVALRRRSKYLLVELEAGWTLVVHLGMSGRFGLLPAAAPVEAHEHFALGLDSSERLRLRDPRRFGLVLMVPTERLGEDRHFRHLGPEPLAVGFDGELLRRAALGRRGPVKGFLMDARIVVGIGNIYACEALHRAGIHPRRSVGRISTVRWSRLADAVQGVLRQAIEEGGTTLNDFADGLGNAGYFKGSLQVYGREGESCSRCSSSIRRFVHGGRSTFYCPGCQR